MLEKLRASMQSGFTYVLVAGLTVIFMFFFGMPTNSCSGGATQRNVYLASVSGTSLYSSDLDLIFNRVYGNTNTMEDDVFAKRQANALRSMVLINLFAERAQEAGLRVSSEEFEEFMTDPVRNMEFRYAYGRDGNWNGPYYQAYVENQMRTTIRKYEQFKRKELLARKYLATQAAQVAVSPVELKDAYKINNTKLNLEFVEFSPESVKDSVELTDEKVQTFIEENPERLQTYYEENKDQYTSEAKYRVRRVYIVKPDDSTEESEAGDIEERWTKAQERVLEKGEDVATVAAELGEDYQKENKGLMDWSSLENMDTAMADAVEKAEVGDVETVETDYAYMLVKLEDKKEAKTTPLEDVQTEIARNILQKEQVDQLIKQSTDALMKKARDAESLQAAIDALAEESDQKIWKNLSAEETGNFTLEGQDLGGRFGGQLAGMMPGNSWARMPKLGTNEEIAATAYKELTEEKPLAEKIFGEDDAKVIVRLKSREEPDQLNPGADLVHSLTSKREGKLVGEWREIFVDGDWRILWNRPTVKFEGWVEDQLAQAVESGTVTFNDRAKVASLVASEFTPAGDASAPKKGKKGKGGPNVRQLKNLQEKMKEAQQKGQGSDQGAQGAAGSGESAGSEGSDESDEE